MTDNARELEAAIRELTAPKEGERGYLRPWMTGFPAPADCRVFIVGRNQANGFDIDTVGSHEHYVDALFNRGGETIRQVYDRVTDGPSPTRRNTDHFVGKLRRQGITDILETNVVCYSTRMSAHLRQPAHRGGAARGREIFRALLSIIKPRVLIAHGGGTASDLSGILGLTLPRPPSGPTKPVEVAVSGVTVFVIPSLAPPAWNRWMRWAPDHLDQVCRRVAVHLA